MNGASVPSQILIVSDERGVIQKMRQDGAQVENFSTGQMLAQLVDVSSREKLFNFLVELRRTGTAFDWEINILVEQALIRYFLAGAVERGQLIIVFSRVPLHALTTLQAMLDSESEQIDAIQRAINDQSMFSFQQTDTDAEMYEEISRINNELVTLQYEVSRKNAELDSRLKERNAQLELTNQLLEEKVAQLEQTQHSLHELSTKYRIVADNTYSWEYWVDADGNFLYSSPSCQRITGFSVEDFMTRPDFLTQRIHPEDLPIWQQHCRAEQSRKEGLQIEFRFCTVDGSYRWVGHVCQPVFDTQGRFLGNRGSNRDIHERRIMEARAELAQTELRKLLEETERSRRALLSVVEDQKLAEERILRLNVELEQRVADRTARLTTANRELEAFAYSVSHDLRAPLRSLDGFSTALREDYADRFDELGLSYLTHIQEASRRMSQLIEDMLSLSRITRSDFSPQKVDLSALIQKVAMDIRSQAPQRRVVWKIAEGMSVMGDRNLLQIALKNLLENAFKFTSRCEQAQIEVGVNQADGETVYFVRDNGAGFDMKYADKLFSPFRRLHKEEDYAGTGIGLTIVQRIVTRHKGRIWPEAAVGLGATFFFTLWEAGGDSL